MDEAVLEQEIKDRGLTAPRLCPDDIDKCIVDKHFYRFPNSSVTVCMLTLVNGYKVIGSTSCVEEANFNAEIGEQVAYDNARNQVWVLEGYRLKEKLFIEENKG